MDKGGDVMNKRTKKAIVIWAILFLILIVGFFSAATYFQSIRNAYFSLSCDGEKIFDERPIEKQFDYQDIKCDDIDLFIEVR